MDNHAPPASIHFFDPYQCRDEPASLLAQLGADTERLRRERDELMEQIAHLSRQLAKARSEYGALVDRVLPLIAIVRRM